MKTETTKEQVNPEAKNATEDLKSECKNCLELKNKIELLIIQNQSLEKKLEDTMQRNLYLMADFENYKKQIDKGLQIDKEHANEKLLKDLLNIVDDLERAIPNIKDEETLKGLNLVYNNLMKLLKEYNIKKIDCIGKQFDANLEEVLMQEDSPEKEGVVLEELQKGYFYKGRVLRFTKVKVAKHIDENPV